MNKIEKKDNLKEWIKYDCLEKVNKIKKGKNPQNGLLIEKNYKNWKMKNSTKSINFVNIAKSGQNIFTKLKD